MSEMCCTRLAGNTGRKKSPQMHRYSNLWFTVNRNTCFKLPLVFWHYYFTR